jgi:hypothetical protein
MLFYERGNPIVNDRRIHEMYIDLETVLLEDMGKEELTTMQREMYKGMPKKWQLLDEGQFTKDQIDKMQNAIKAPMSEELDEYLTLNKPMTLPVNNKNASEWRDEKRSVDTVDYNSKLIDVDRERRQEFFTKRYERPKEISE